jgi:hypothetical protein
MLQKLFFTFVTLLMLQACQPSNDAVAQSSKTKLQSTLDEHKIPAEVTSISVVQDEGRKYVGEAQIKSFDANFKFKFKAIADNKNVVLDDDPIALALLTEQITSSRLAILKDAYSSEVLNERIFDLMPDTLSEFKTKFKDRLQVVPPVTKTSNYWFGTGCMAHMCGAEMAAWTISSDGVGYAVILEQGKVGSTYYTFGAEPDKLPSPLLRWAIENGMTAFNSVQIRRQK